MRLLKFVFRTLPFIILFTHTLASAQQTASATPSTAHADAWPQFRGNASLTGVSDTTLPAKLTLQWTYEADEAIDSSAAIVDGSVYVGTWAGTLIALDLETGAERWTYSTGDMGIGESSPAVAGGLVFIGDLGGVFHAVDTETGVARWTFETMGEIKSSPVIVGDRVLIGSYDGYLYALAIADGTLAWKYETLNYVHATPAVWNGVAYFGGCDELFHGVRVSDGQEVVSISATAYTAASPVITDGKVFFGTFDTEATLPLLLLGTSDPRHDRDRRTRQDDTCHRPTDGCGQMDLHYSSKSRCLASSQRQSRLRRFKRRPTLRPRPEHR